MNAKNLRKGRQSLDVCCFMRVYTLSRKICGAVVFVIPTGGNPLVKFPPKICPCINVCAFIFH